MLLSSLAEQETDIPYSVVHMIPHTGHDCTVEGDLYCTYHVVVVYSTRRGREEHRNDVSKLKETVILY